MLGDSRGQPCPYACQDPNMWDLDLRCVGIIGNRPACALVSPKSQSCLWIPSFRESRAVGLGQCLRGLGPRPQSAPPNSGPQGQSGVPQHVWTLSGCCWCSCGQISRHEGWVRGSWTPRHLSREVTQKETHERKQQGQVPSPFCCLRGKQLRPMEVSQLRVPTLTPPGTSYYTHLRNLTQRPPKLILQRPL